MPTYTIGYIIGSLAKTSINRRLAGALVKLAPPNITMREISFRELPIYCYDFDPDYPEVARTFKQQISEVDAILFVTPEYNRSIPGGLKNAIDWASRPYGQNAFTRKPAAIVGTSSGKIGTAVVYPRPLHLQPAFADLGLGAGSFPNAERAARELLALPMFPGLAPDAPDRVVEALGRALRK